MATIDVSNCQRPFGQALQNSQAYSCSPSARLKKQGIHTAKHVPQPVNAPIPSVRSLPCLNSLRAAQKSASASSKSQRGSWSDRPPSRTSKLHNSSKKYIWQKGPELQRLASRQLQPSKVRTGFPTQPNPHFSQRPHQCSTASMALPAEQIIVVDSALGSGDPCASSPVECMTRAVPSFESPPLPEERRHDHATGSKRKRDTITASGEKCSSMDTDKNVGSHFVEGQDGSAERTLKKARLVEPAQEEHQVTNQDGFSMAFSTHATPSGSPPLGSMAATIAFESQQVVQRSEQPVTRTVKDASELGVVFELVYTGDLKEGKLIRNFVCCSLSPAFVIFLASRAEDPSQKVFVKFMPYNAPSMGFKSNLDDLLQHEVAIPSSFAPFFQAQQTEGRALADAYSGIQYLLKTDNVCYSMKSYNVPMLVSISEASPLCEPTLVPIDECHSGVPDLKAMVLAAQIVKSHGFQHQHKLTPHMHKLRAVARMYVVRQLLEAAAFLNSQDTWLGCVNVLDITIFQWKETHEPAGGEKISVPIIKVARRWRTDDVTAANVAPEMNDDPRVQPGPDGKVDAFAIGCVLFTLITLVLPSNDPELVGHGFPLRFDCERLDEYFCDADGAFTVEAFMLHDLTQVNPKYRLSPADVLRKYAKYLPTFP